MRHRTILVMLILATVGAAAACSIRTGRPKPDLPVKPAGYAEILDVRIPYGDAVANEDRFQGPHFSLWMTHTATTDALDSGWADGLNLDREYRAAPGHEFVLAHFGLTGPDFAPRWENETTATVSAAVSTGGRKIPLTTPPTEEQTLVVSVPRTAPVFLEITDEGRTQSINLRDGTRGPDAASLYNPLRSQSLATHHQLSGTVRGGAAEGQCLVNMVAHYAVLDPYHPAHGWAPDGRAWLQVKLDALVASSATRGYFFLVEFEIDIPATFGLTPSGGQRVPATPTDKITLQSFSASYLVLFDVPDSFRTGNVAVTPNGSMKAEDATGEVPMTWIQPPAPWELEINLPA